MTERQLTVFDLLRPDGWETPVIPVERQKKGTKGWIIQRTGIFLRENGFNDDWCGVATIPVVLERDTERDQYGLWQSGRSLRGPAQGWMASPREIFARRPTWNDCLKYMAETRTKRHPEAVRYYEQSADFSTAKYEY